MIIRHILLRDNQGKQLVCKMFRKICPVMVPASEYAFEYVISSRSVPVYFTHTISMWWCRQYSSHLSCAMHSQPMLETDPVLAPLDFREAPKFLAISGVNVAKFVHRQFVPVLKRESGSTGGHAHRLPHTAPASHRCQHLPGPQNTADSERRRRIPTARQFGEEGYDVLVGIKHMST